MDEAGGAATRVKSDVADIRTRHRHRTDRLLIALLCIVGVLAWLFTMYSMSHPRSEAVGSMSTHGVHTSTLLAHEDVGAAANVDANLTNPAAVWSDSEQIGGVLSCAIVGVGCMLALLALVVRLALARPAMSRIRRMLPTVKNLQFVRQKYSIRPSLIALSISRT